ncbi:MAG: DUF1015 domain-containing protein [Treponemataceae bacterium]|nr:DUF1015 domain-containing protein [Treponemataceae bacterium]
MKSLEKYGIKLTSILLPKKQFDLEKWAVIACDQFTQDRDYWNKVENFVADQPSTLKVTLPEVYLNDGDKAARIEKVNSTMNEYLENDVFENIDDSMIYIERKTAYGRMRKGLVCAIDLETYDWVPFSPALIRATEATILERIPPRVEIRKNAPLEFPHIMLLVNDEDRLLVEKTGQIAKNEKALYSTDLMMNSGSISGWQVNKAEELDNIENALKIISEKQTQKDGSVFMFAVGDGNHSLATAKTIWNKLKEEGAPADSPARYALIEIVNIYDEGLTFEPIHRVLFNQDADNLIEAMKNALNAKIEEFDSAEKLEKAVSSSKADFGFVYEKNGKTAYTCLKTQITELAVSRLQPALDEYLNANNSAKEDIDYIHGSDEVFRLGGKNGALSILLPPIAKDSFFATIAKSGPLPRKSFSMGEASEKRFYMEGRKIK